MCRHGSADEWCEGCQRAIEDTQTDREWAGWASAAEMDGAAADWWYGR